MTIKIGTRVQNIITILQQKHSVGHFGKMVNMLERDLMLSLDWSKRRYVLFNKQRLSGNHFR